MARTRQDGEQTRRNILASAAKLFAQKGYESTTIAEICRDCHVNIALVNYHFGNKENLYRRAWRDAWERTNAKYPADDGVSEYANAEIRLRGHIASLLKQNADPECCDEEIWRKELAQPTGLLTELRDKMVVPLRDALRENIRALLGTAASESVVNLCTMSVMAQCRVPIGKRRTGEKTFIKIDLDERIEHVWRFSLAGIYACGNSTTKTAPASDGAM
ncbi:MAG: CerR family C-terminal domain-containing protein [Planctomycetia bacterium]|nr:CerR family C-terminal domain-containing protein [Planctomycetia bacterium]